MSNFKVSNNGGDDWLICWTGQDEKGVHWNVTTNQVHASELFQFSKGAEEDARLIAKLLDMHYTGQLIHTESIQNKLANYDAQAEQLKQVEANYDALQTPMPCGHLARYAVNGEEGTQYCVVCNGNALFEAGNKALAVLEERNKLFEQACLFLAYQGYGLSADKFADLPLDVQKYILGMFNLEARP